MYRQGDILLIRTEKSKHIIGEKQHHKILAEGEITGHLHEVQGDQATLYGEDHNSMFLEVKSPSDLTHHEHSTILVEPGFYRVVRQREYSPQGSLMVID